MMTRVTVIPSILIELPKTIGFFLKRSIDMCNKKKLYVRFLHRRKEKAHTRTLCTSTLY